MAFMRHGVLGINRRAANASPLGVYMANIKLLEDWNISALRENKNHLCSYCGYVNQVMYEVGWQYLCYDCAIRNYSTHHFICSICGCSFENKHYSSEEKELLCKDCKKRYLKEYSSVYNNNKRTERLGLHSNLLLCEWIDIIKMYSGKCVYCGGTYNDMDHIIPVSKGGGTTKNNVVPSCRKCNLRKGNA